MNYLEINKRIAIACGETYYHVCPNHGATDLDVGDLCPWCGSEIVREGENYHGDLNAIHQATLQLCNNEGLRVRFFMELEGISRGLAVSENDDSFWFVTSPASDRCEALCKTLELWEEEA